MFLLPLILLPFTLVLALRRLYLIARQLACGQLVLPARQRALWGVAAATAYLALAGYSLALVAALARVLFAATDRLSAYLALAGYVLAYPLVYFGAAWIFFYALRPAIRGSAAR